MENIEKASGLLTNTGSVIALVVGLVAIVGIIAILIAKGKLNFKSEKFSIDSAKQNTHNLLEEARETTSLLILDFANKYIDKYPNDKYRILYTCEVCMNFFEKCLHKNNITMDEDYLSMRWTSLRAIISTHRIEGVEYSDEFYKSAYETYKSIIKQIVLLKKHYGNE